MRRTLRLVAFLAALLAPAAAGAWEIASFEALVLVHPDATATVVETIVADFGSEPHHGLYRDIPVHMTDRVGQHVTLRFRIQEVSDGTGRLWPCRLETHGRYRRLWIGDPASLVTGPQTYRIVYGVQRGAVRWFPAHEECYWNLTGNEWAVPIRRVRAEIRAPETAANLRAIAYVGGYGSTTRLGALRIVDSRAVFEPSAGLGPYEGLTAAVAWDKGAVHPPALGQVAGWWLEDNWVYGFPLALLLGMAWLWWIRGRDPRLGRSKVVQYQPPEGFTPAEVGTLMDQRVDVRDITSTVIDLAVRGYLTMQPTQTSWLRRNDYRLTLVKPWHTDPALAPHERELLEGLFGREGGRTSVEVSDLEQQFYARLPAIRTALYARLTAAGYLDGNPETVRTAYQIGAVVVGAVMWVLLRLFQAMHQLPPVPLALASGLSALIVGLFGLVMPRRTLKGARATEDIRGFLEFLTRTDQDRIRQLNDPGLFERCLPYALAFGVAEQWARAFEGLYTHPPAWYHGGAGGFSPSRLGRDLNQASDSFGHAFTSQPRASSSASGFGGGGFSGGGGGGGGGGAW